MEPIYGIPEIPPNKLMLVHQEVTLVQFLFPEINVIEQTHFTSIWFYRCLLYTSDAADERSSGDLGGRRIIKKTTKKKNT